MSNIRLPSDRHLNYNRRQWQLYLLFCVVMAMGIIVAVILPGDNSEVVLGPAAAVAAALFILMLALYLAVRGRNPTEFDREHRRIAQDEWFAASRNRARRDALLTVIFAQVPLMFFMSYVPEEPSLVGMGVMTTALGCGTFTASYLFRTRTDRDE